MNQFIEDENVKLEIPVSEIKEESKTEKIVFQSTVFKKDYDKNDDTMNNISEVKNDIIYNQNEHFAKNKYIIFLSANLKKIKLILNLI